MLPERILIIDDEPMIRTVFRGLLSSEGYAFLEAGDGQEGIDTFRRERPDLVITDLRMPGVDGLGVIAAITAESPATPVIVVSGIGTVHEAIGAIRLGAWDYVTKPVMEAAELLHTIRRTFERARLMAENRNYREGLEHEIRRRTTELRDSEERFRALFENANDAILLLGINGRILSCNRKALELFARGGDEIARRTLLDFSPAEQPDGASSASLYWQHVSHALEGEPQFFEWQHVRPDGETFDAEISLNQVVIQETTFMQALIRDNSAHKRYEEQLKRQASHDDLTGLPNRRLLHEMLNGLIPEAASGNRQLSALLLDLDNFKYINDTLGHPQGDELLRQVANRLLETATDVEMVGRFMGDEFVLLMSPREPREAEGLARGILEAFRTPFLLGQTELFMTPSIGIASYPGAGETAELLLRNGEAAMYEARKQGAGRFQVYSPEINAQADARLKMGNRLHKALDRGEFALHYQPQFDLSTMAITGMEALLRWTPEGGAMVSPAVFIPVLEEAGLIVPVGEWVLSEACRQLRAWLDAGIPPLKLSVNVSAWQFHSGRLVDTVRTVLAETRIDPALVCLELTESIVMHDVEETIRQLHALRDLGVSLSIDDFGTGYSSLSYLRRMPIHELKIDRSFVMNLPQDANCAAIVNTILGMADGLNLSVVAEGVETEEQLRFLAGLKCETGQGYLYSKPLPPAALERFVRETAALAS
ncbi:MAG TPA: EAL domain-containing protein [Candidatus Deferrimicrobiaceae bacterium]|jgi:diguanylate cyclase (GGDEF)-like protein/PAS domain S-box-containing protein